MLSINALHILCSALCFCFIRLVCSQSPSALPTLPATNPPTASQFATLFTYTGGVQQYIVPANAYTLSVKLVGASGGDATAASQGGKGSKVEFTLASVTPGSTISVYVGGQGAYGVVSGGFNGGGGSTYSKSGSGGGATDIRTGTSLSARIAVAGGGGGADALCPSSGGDAGYPTGLAGGYSATNCGSPGTGGGGGTESAGGAAGTSPSYGSGLLGSFGLGANGCSTGGAGGGGGYYGGGSTCGAAGGGGSSFSSVAGAIHTPLFNKGHGYVKIEYQPSPSAKPSVAPTRPTANPTAAPSRPTVNPSAAPSRPTAAPSAYPLSLTFAFTGGVQQCTVPPGAVSATVRLNGAAGGDISSTIKGGKGGRVEATFITLTPGSTLYIFVGGKGAYGVVPGGFNGGGASTYSNSASGGGATDIRMSLSLNSRLAVAGGGGGSDGYCVNSGGDGGAPSGMPGGNIVCDGAFAAGGGGSQSSGGVAGFSSEYGTGLTGFFGQGGNGS